MSRSTANYPGLLYPNIGAIGELRVSADLLARGYDVFRAVSPCAKVDLVALKGGRTIRVEVKTGAYSGLKGKVYHIPLNPSRFDVLAIALPDRIAYEPSGVVE